MKYYFINIIIYLHNNSSAVIYGNMYLFSLHSEQLTRSPESGLLNQSDYLQLTEGVALFSEWNSGPGRWVCRWERSLIYFGDLQKNSCNSTIMISLVVGVRVFKVLQNYTNWHYCYQWEEIRNKSHWKWMFHVHPRENKIYQLLINNNGC